MTIFTPLFPGHLHPPLHQKLWNSQQGSFQGLSGTQLLLTQSR